MLAALESEFRSRFGAVAEVAARSPGRVNLIGEHTDYNEGLVLPCAVDRYTWALIGRRDDGRVRIFSREQAAQVGFEAAAPTRGGDWTDYARGVFAALHARGLAVPGADIAVASDIPLGSGLSSSAALTVALVTALDRCFALGLDPRARCEVAHAAETDFVGVPCGIMDPFACGLARRDAALRIDCRSREVRYVPWPATSPCLLVAHSGVPRSLADGGYAARRRECEQALDAARRAGIGPADATALRDFGAEHLVALARALRRIPFRRVRHVIRENLRVDATCAALEAGDLAAVGALLRQGMRSLREDFDVSTPELEWLCRLADDSPGVYGSRLTGAGFGGCTLHLVDPAALEAVSEAIATGFEARFGRRPPLYALRPADGARVVEP